jgi:CRP-like cAMP-binding protein
MALDSRPRPKAQRSMVDALVAKGRYPQALAAFLVECAGRPPTPADRLRLADLLVLADRGEEAVPILLHVADEQKRNGYHYKALEALRRADAIAPGRSEIRRRFAELARSTQAARETRAKPTVRPDPPLDENTAPFLFVPLGTPRPIAAGAPEPEPLRLDPELCAFVSSLGDRPAAEGRGALAATLFSGLQQYLFRRVSAGLRRRRAAAGSVLVTEGEPGNSIFVIASGSVRILVLGGHGRSLEIRRLDAGDFFGEVAALSGQNRTATVVAVTDCELLEIEHWALECLLEARPAARPILEQTRVGRTQSPEETTVRSLPPAATPSRAAAALKAYFERYESSPRVRLQIARLMVDAGQQEDALAVLASVAEDLSAAGQTEQGLAILKKLEQIQRRGAREVFAQSRRPASPSGAGARASSPSRAATEAAFREWVGTLLRKTDTLAARSGADATPKAPAGRRQLAR